MANTITKYTDAQMMKSLLTRDFSDIGREFIDDMVVSVKPTAFLSAQNLDTLSLPALKDVHYRAFEDCSVQSLGIPWGQLERIGYCAFYRMPNGIPQNLVLTNVTALNNGAFAGNATTKNTQIRSVTLPSWTGSSYSEGSGFSNSASNSMGAFAYCSAMTSFSAPELQSVPYCMLYYCSAIEEIILPKVTSINSNAFGYCTKLKKLEIGGAVTKFSSAFINYSNAMEALILRGVTTVPTITSSVFSNSPISKKTCYVYVPKSLENSFKVASYWSTYASQIRAIEDYPDICGS